MFEFDHDWGSVSPVMMEFVVENVFSRKKDDDSKSP